MDLKELQKHIRTLATLQETSAPVVSCYLDRANGGAGWRAALDQRVGLLRASLEGEPLAWFEEALRSIEDFLAEGVLPGTKGLALFARGGEQPFFLPLQFQAPLANWIAAGSAPRLFQLVELKDTYYRYVALIATARSVRILGVSLGEVTQDLWTQRPELRDRAGRGWSREHYQSFRREQTARFVQEQVSVLDRLMSSGGYAHLILAGSTKAVAQVKSALPTELAEKVIDIVPASEYDRTSDVVAATLAAFIEEEERESLAAVERLQKEIQAHGLAVAGAAASYEALKSGQADVLVMAKAFAPEPGWACQACEARQLEAPAPNHCPRCCGGVKEFNLREELLRLAEQTRTEVELVGCSDVLMQLGGVGCLLRFSNNLAA